MSQDQRTRRQILSALGLTAAAGAVSPFHLAASVASTENGENAPLPGGSMALTRINHFSAKPGSGDDLYELIDSFLPFIRESDGCLEARLLRGVDDADQIVVIERWRDQDAHRASAQKVPPGTFEKAMALMSGPPSGAYYQ